MSTGFGKGLLILALLTVSSAGAEDTSWVTQSNANAAPLLEVMARYAPETAAAFGVEGHDSEVLDLEPGYDTRFEADLAKVVVELESRIGHKRCCFHTCAQFRPCRRSRGRGDRRRSR